MAQTYRLDGLLESAKAELTRLDARRAELIKEIRELEGEQSFVKSVSEPTAVYPLNPKSSAAIKTSDRIALFRALFRGREDVFPRRFESKTTGKSGYQPACRNEWVKGICNKPKIKCNECGHRDYRQLTDEIIRAHLRGRDPFCNYDRDFVVGVYPLLEDETCWFLAADFDKETWTQDIFAFVDACSHNDVPVYIERSRSGNGGHAWIFFSQPISAAQARKLGSTLLTEAMDKRPELGFRSYDRFFPNQDTMPKGGFGNLIALPLQKRPLLLGNSAFIDRNLNPYPDQGAFLSSVRRMTAADVSAIVDSAVRKGTVLGVRSQIEDEDCRAPWKQSPSRKAKLPEITGVLPKRINIVLGNQIFIPKDGLPAALRNRIMRIAAFQNPEFYKAQAMRFPVYNKPRIICCCQDFPDHIGVPRGCIDELLDLLGILDIQVELRDERNHGASLDIAFNGSLRPDQEAAATSLLSHDCGVLSATTAFGKTVVAIYLLAKRRTNTLVLVHRRQLLDQWMERLHSFLAGPSKIIGQIAAGKKGPTGIIDVALMQSLVKKGVVDDIVGEYGHMIVDECHHVSAVSFEQVARQCKAKFVTGLSATLLRKDGHHPIIFMQCGPVRFHVDEKKQALSRPFTHRVLVRNTGFALPQNLKDTQDVPISEIFSALAADEGRNELIINDIISCLREGRNPVVLSERVEHVAKLAKLIEAHVTPVVLTGGMGKKARQLQIERLRSQSNSRNRVLIATGKYLGEGFDDERLDTLFLTLPVSWKGTVTQYAGRLHRLNDAKKEVLIYDYLDASVPVLRKMFDRRCKGYRAIGYDISDLPRVGDALLL